MAVRNIQIDSRNPASGVTITCSPPDSLSSSTQPSPSSFSCTSTVSYTFTAPAKVGYNTFSHWVDAKTTPNTDLPEGVTGNVTVTGNRLVLAPPLVGARYIAMYTVVSPATVNISSTVPQSGVLITASVADLNGKTVIYTPDSFSYLDNGTKVGFTIDPHFIIKLPSLLHSYLVNTYDLLGWHSGLANKVAVKTYNTTIRGPQDIVVDYTKTAPPWYPTDQDVELMNTQLKLAIPPASILDQYMLLWDDSPVSVSHKWMFKDSATALIEARKLLLSVYPDWVARLPSATATWARDPVNKNVFINYVLTNRFSAMLFSDFKKYKLVKTTLAAAQLAKTV